PSQPSSPSGGPRLPKVSGGAAPFAGPNPKTAFHFPESHPPSSGNAAQESGQGNTELMQAIKELTAAVKGLKDAMDKQTRQAGGKPGGAAKTMLAGGGEGAKN